MSFGNYLTKAISENNYDSIKSFPNDLMDKDEKKTVAYIHDYHTKYGSVPMQSVVLTEVPNSFLVLSETVPTESLEQLRSEALRTNFEREIRDYISGIQATENVNYVEVSKKIERYNSLLREVKVVDYNDFSLYTPPTSRYHFKYNQLEVATNSLLDSEVALLVGRMKTGKTWITLDLALDAYINQDKKVYFTSLEMGVDQLKQRIHAMIGKFNPSVFRVGTQAELKVAKAKYETENSLLQTNGEFIIPYNMTRTIWDVKRDIEKYKPDMVFIDSIYLFQDENGRPIQNDWGSLANMIATVKSMARENEIQVIVNSQLKRGSGKDSGELTDEDIAYSDSFAQTCDLIVGLTSDLDSGIDRTKMQIIASRNSGKDAVTFLDFNWNDCSIKEYVPKLLKSHGVQTI